METEASRGTAPIGRRAKICDVKEIDISADELVVALTRIGCDEIVCILDSGGATHLGSHLLIAGVRPVDVLEISHRDPGRTLGFLDRRLKHPNLAAVFTLSYDFGAKLYSIAAHASSEPDLFIALFDCLIVHDYNDGRTFLTGRSSALDKLESVIAAAKVAGSDAGYDEGNAVSNFSREDYMAAVDLLKDKIRCGLTYQTNLTQQITAKLGRGNTAEKIFLNLRKSHPAPFGAYIKRIGSTVVSASPERFLKSADGLISASPIKGTRPRGTNGEEDRRLADELLSSEKDIAENTMIVDLTRNDLGRVCEYGSVAVTRLCEVERHPTLFHLVSTVEGRLRSGPACSDIIRAVFPCGSITGAPKSSTMKIIRSVENLPRGLSMGSIGLNIPAGFEGLEPKFEMSVAIRTMVVRGEQAVFNVGGGIVIDSDPAAEYEESMLKARALLAAAGVKGGLGKIKL